MKLPGFIQRGKTYYIRKHVPPCLQEAIGKTEFVESLKTSDRAVAEQRYHARYAEILTLLNQDHDTQAQPAIPLTAGEHYRRILDAEFPYRVKIRQAAYKDEKAFWAGDIIEPPEDEFWYHLLVDATELDAALSYCFRARLKKQQKAAMKALRTGDRLDFPNEMSDNQVAAALKAEVKAIDELLEEATPEFGLNSPDTKKEKQGPLLSAVVDKWIEEHESKWKKDHKITTTATLRDFMSVAGDMSLGEFNECGKRFVRKYKNILAKLPPNIHKRNDYKGFCLEAIVKKAADNGLKPMSEKTANRRIGILITFFKWVQANYDELKHNPAEGMKFKVNSDTRKEREPFTTEELKTMFSAPIYTGCRSERHWKQKGSKVLDDTAKYWVPLIGLYSGMRAGEIIQLHKDDIQYEDGVYYFNIEASTPGDAGPDTKQLKNSTSRREIPVHKVLLDLGFIEYVQSCTTVRIFKEFVKTKGKDSWSDQFSKHFRRFMTACGLNRPKTSFHSFRHSFADACRQAGIPETERKALLGHSDGQFTTYGSGYKAVQLNKYLQKINYKGLSFVNHSL